VRADECAISARWWTNSRELQLYRIRTRLKRQKAVSSLREVQWMQVDAGERSGNP